MGLYLRARMRDGVRIIQLLCPDCRQWGEIDDDQYHGRVSIDHTDSGCSFHETINFATGGVDKLASAPETEGGTQ